VRGQNDPALLRRPVGVLEHNSNGTTGRLVGDGMRFSVEVNELVLHEYRPRPVIA
jgi:hypothetical protein